MLIQKLLRRGYLEEKEPSAMELQDLLSIVDRDFADSHAPGISSDWQFGIAYNAALKLATIVIRASGYRVKSGAHHKNTISLLPALLGKSYQDDSEYLDACRIKRNAVEYTQAGGITSNEVTELQGFVAELRGRVLTWCEKKNISIELPY